jgi:hypothetical protein
VVLGRHLLFPEMVEKAQIGALTGLGFLKNAEGRS